jgi:phosphoglycolate phosphatase
MTRLILWDIDLTLLDLRGLGGFWFREAILEVTGRRTPAELPSFAGRTDRWITQQLLLAVGETPTEALVQRVQQVATSIFTERRADIAERGTVLPGAREALIALHGRPAVAQTVLTGNLPGVAAPKLAAFGLDLYLDLEIGAFGDLSELRDDLVPHALALATAKHGGPVDAVVVGDTPHDVAAARNHGLSMIAVTTGRFGAAELAEAGAPVVLPNLISALPLLLG